MAPKRNPSSNHEAEPSYSRFNCYYKMRLLVLFEKFFHSCVECNYCYRPLLPHLVEKWICLTCRNKQHRIEKIGLGEAVSTYALPVSSFDPLASLTDARERILEELVNRLTEHMSIKWYLSITVSRTKINRESEEVYAKTMFKGEMEMLLLTSEFDEQSSDYIDLVMRRMKEFIGNGLTWSV